MDLGLCDRAVWLLLEDTPMAWDIAETCLEEGANVALIVRQVGVEGAVRRAALAARFGLRLRFASCNQATPLVGPPPADLLLWAGRPSAIIAFRPERLDCGDETRGGRVEASCVGSLQPGGGLVLVEANWRGRDEDDGGLPALRQARLQWQSRAAEGVRVSIIAAPGSPGRCEGAVGALVVFLA
ncbi:MAG TPA: hypothetical protein VFH92_05380, partial [Phenylobacterium sp.]|nr:hypothetical protein [Phenylobacterium sp.]